MAVPAGAVRTRSFRADSYSAFRAFKAEGVAISSDGRAYVAPQAALLADPGARTVWGLAADGKGRMILATGDQGRVLAVPTSGKKPEAAVLADLFDYEIFALASDGKGTVFAAGAPTGTISRISPDGKVSSLFKIPEQVVFALLAAPDGSVYAGAGEHGRLYRITPQGEAKVVSESADQAIRSLAWGPEGKIWAGTSGRGLVEEIAPDGATRVVYDAGQEEIVAIVPLPEGGLIFGANPGNAPSGSVSQADAGDPDKGGSSGSSGSASTGGSTGGIVVSASTDRPMLYRMDPDGGVHALWRCPERMIHALALDPDGAVLVATADAAAVYRVTPDGEESVLWQPEEDQVLSLALEGRTLYAGTGSPGRLYRIGPQPATEGIFTSEVLDAHNQARWGVLRYDGTAPKGSLSFETRTGFTDPVDGSWSDWTSLKDSAEGSLVASPPARYLQWRAKMEPEPDGGPVLRRVQISYGSPNARPRITSLRISPTEPLYTRTDQGHGITQVLPGGVQVDYSMAPPHGPVVAVDEVPTWVRRIRTVLWDASDPDNDDLAFTVEIRAVGEKDFRVLARNVRNHGWSMESGTVPDGVYEIRVTASDSPSNPAGTELSDSKLTPPFHVDTVAPVITDLKARKVDGHTVEISGVAQDESSPLRRIDASIDGSEFHWLTPDDGLMDSPREAFRGTVPLEAGDQGAWIVVRAQDEAGNRGSYRTWLGP